MPVCLAVVRMVGRMDRAYFVLFRGKMEADSE